MENMGMMSRETVIRCLERLSVLLGAKGVVGEIDIVGGAAMMLAFHARQSTKDVDAIFAPVTGIREAARLVAAVKGFLSPQGDFTSENVLQFPHLRVLAPEPGYMLAMK